jgi:hypothetical protein
MAWYIHDVEGRVTRGGEVVTVSVCGCTTVLRYVDSIISLLEMNHEKVISWTKEHNDFS